MRKGLVDRGGDGFEGQGGVQTSALDEERRRSIHPGVAGTGDTALQGRDGLGIGDAGLKPRLADAEPRRDPQEGVARAAAVRPFGLAVHQGVDDLEIAIFACAPRQQNAGGGEVGGAGDEFAIDQPDPPGVDVAPPEFGQHLDGEAGAGAAGGRGVFDQGHGRVSLAQHHVVGFGRARRTGGDQGADAARHEDAA